MELACAEGEGEGRLRLAALRAVGRGAMRATELFALPQSS
jgi:hypothetical protein